MIGTWIPLAGLEARGRGGFAYLNMGGEGFREAEHRYSVWRGHQKFKAEGSKPSSSSGPQQENMEHNDQKKMSKSDFLFNLLRYPGMD